MGNILQKNTSALGLAEIDNRAPVSITGNNTRPAILA